MATASITQERSFGEAFKESVYELVNGERMNTCIQCGACSGVCPFGYWMELAPHQMVARLREGAFNRDRAAGTAWLCVSCYACANVCPQQIPLTTTLITRTREELLSAGELPNELEVALRNSQRYGNFLGESPRKRSRWTRGIEPPVALMAKAGRPVDLLWFVGDYASYHPRVQMAVKALARLLNALEVDFAILGREEVSDGDSQRLAGENGLFEMLAEKNGRLFEKYAFNEIITTDPHAYNALKNEYPRLGIDYPVRHYTEFLAERLDEVKPLLKQEVEALVTYHDPCYLGRANGIYEEPRAILEAIPGVQLVEMSHHGANSLCCGNGGGGLWLQGFQWDKTGNRLAEWRVREAIQAGPAKAFSTAIEQKRRRKAYRKEAPLPCRRILAVACPYETPCFEEAAKLVPEADELQVMDIAELLVEAMGQA